MEKKIRFIMIGLAGILLISLFLNFQLNNAKQIVEQERNNLKKENAALGEKIDQATQSNKWLQDKMSLLNRELDRASKEKEDLQRRYELANKEREGLIEKLKTKPTVVVQEVQKPQEPVVTNDAYWAGVLKSKTELELQLEKVRQELKTIQINNEQLKREKVNLELDISSLNQQNQDLKIQFEYNQKILDSLTQELVREKNDKFQIQNTLKKVKNENEVFRRQLKSLNERKVSLEKRLAELQTRNKEMEDNLEKMNTFVKEKMLKIDELQGQLEGGPVAEITSPEMKPSGKSSVELPPIVVRPSRVPAGAGMGGGREGKILLINRENNFVIIDLGEEAGVRVGDVFDVYRQGSAIAHLEVIQVRRNIAACDIRKETTPLKRDDTVK